MSKTNYDIKGIYIENITAEIFNAISELIPINTTDKKFIEAQKKVFKIISREYVEKEK
jgi:hypothetical protein